MTNFETPQPVDDGGMGSAHKAYGELGEPLTQEDDTGRYRALAAHARGTGDIELANRLDQYARDVSFDSQKLNAFMRRNIEWVQETVRQLAQQSAGRETVTFAIPGGRVSEATLSAIRRTLFAPDDLERGIVEPVLDSKAGTSRYVVPMRGGMKYIETYDEKEGLIEIEIEKSTQTSSGG